MRLLKSFRTIGLLSLLMYGTYVQAQSNPKAEAIYGDGANSFSLATGSPGELGLLQALGEEFGKRENAKMVWIKAGSGASLNQLKNSKLT